MTSVPYVPTITIIEDPDESTRGYSLVDREFFLKYQEAIEAEAEWKDGTKLTDRYYVVDLKEYVRVVPEAYKENYNWTKDVLIPVQLCIRSFKPSYLK